MSKKRIKIATLKRPDGTVQRRTVWADVDGHLAVNKHEEGVKPWWAVTHIPSGYAVGFFDHEESAIGFRDAIKDIVDWAEVSPELQPGVRVQRPAGMTLRQFRKIKEIRAYWKAQDDEHD